MTISGEFKTTRFNLPENHVGRQRKAPKTDRSYIINVIYLLFICYFPIGPWSIATFVTGSAISAILSLSLHTKKNKEVKKEGKREVNTSVPMLLPNLLSGTHLILAAAACVGV